MTLDKEQAQHVDECFKRESMYKQALDNDSQSILGYIVAAGVGAVITAILLSK